MDSFQWSSLKKVNKTVRAPDILRKEIKIKIIKKEEKYFKIRKQDNLAITL